ncbi:hypothetical protein DFJ58DRAFT_848190 [Suillus subalutaceus]|uniref:uncharacterized protein n=1 Tax=Suillus subalutaceus TaxID=48586 RepID=UPI001B874323|nr:uncharacterized protein DFJ58DRAFT_848190 [Suillus subalutaceus]KAG1831655.1 hypothetical protein DFJ58DRAFT_848190 [Suillus subalutaceus]
MSNKDTLVIIPSSLFDSGSNISKDPTKTWADAPDGEIESRPLDIPDDWRPPSHLFARFCFTQLCLIILGKPDLGELWQDVSHEAGWDKVMGNDLWKALDHRGCWYLPFLRRVFGMWELSGLLFLLEFNFRVLFATTTFEIEIQEIWAHAGDFLTWKPPKGAILICLAFSCIADLHLALSWTCLASCGLGLLLEVNAVNCWMFLAVPCMFAPFFFGVTLGYLQQIWDRDCRIFYSM